MEVQISVFGAGVTIPWGKKGSLGLSVLCEGYIRFRHNVWSKASEPLLIHDLVSISDSSALVCNQIKTDWFRVSPEKSNWIYNRNALLGRTFDLEVSGANIVRGKVDISLTVYDKLGDPQVLIDKCCIDAWGVQIAPFKVRGKLKRHMPPKYLKTKDHMIPENGVVR